MAALSVAAAPTHADTLTTQWISGTATANSWSLPGNWDQGVPDSTINAATSENGASIDLGPAAQANTFLVQGPIGGASSLASGTLTLTDQLWINVSSTGTLLRLYDSGSAPVSVTANAASIAVDAGTRGGVVLDSRTGGSVALTVITNLTIGYQTSGGSVTTAPLLGTPGGSASITADTIQASVLSTAGQTGPNLIGTYNSNHTVSATNLNLGIAGSKGAAELFGGTWTIGNTALGDQATSTNNSLTITDSGTLTNSAAFTVGVRGTDSTVYVGTSSGALATTDGTLRLTGANDLVIGFASTADRNAVLVDDASRLSANGNVVVGIDGHTNSFVVDNSSTAVSGGARLGVNAGASGNTATVSNAATWTINGTVRVGSAGSSNEFKILDGGTATLTASAKNFFVGYERSASNNRLVVSGSGSTLSVKASNADLVISANATGTGANSTGNVVTVSNGGALDVNRMLVGDGGTVTGDQGTVRGSTLVGTGGQLAPGLAAPIGLLNFIGSVDLSNGGTYTVTIGSGSSSDLIDVTGTLTLGGTSTLALSGPFADADVAHVIAHYGTLSGTFASITGLPAGGFVDYNFRGLNEIAVIRAVPEPSAVCLALAGLACGGYAMRRRRRI